MLISLDFYPHHVPLTSQLAPAASAFAATCAWGVSDFVGGYASRRANPFLLTTITHVSGTSLMVFLALLFHSPFPGRHALIWAMAAGLSGGVALAFFYRALSQGNMGLTAPVSAVLGAAIPTAFGIFTEGAPGPVPIIGFFLAGIGIWLISRSEGPTGKPRGLGTAFLAGIGFAGYFLGMREAGSGSVFWLAGMSRVVAFFTTGTIVLVARQFGPMDRTGVRWGLTAGVLDVTGSAMFIFASQTGRLDAAVLISSLYPAITVLLARLFLNEHFSRWKVVGLLAALLAVPLIAS